MDFSFDSIKIYLANTLSQLSNWTKTILNASVYGRINDVISYAMEKMAYYVDFWFGESAWRTMKLRSSAVNKAPDLLYNVHRYKGAFGLLKVSAYNDSFTEPQLSLDAISNKNIDNAVAVDLTNGIVGIPLTNHGFQKLQLVNISGTVNYNGIYQIQSVSTNQFTIQATYVAETFAGTELVTLSILKYIEDTTQILKYTEFINDQDSSIEVYFKDTVENYYKNTKIIDRYINTGSTAINIGNGLVGFDITNNLFPLTQTISIRGTVNYDGDYQLDASSTNNRLIISHQYIAETFDGTEHITTGNLYINVKEGIPKTFKYTALGTVNEQIKVLSAFTDNDIIDVYIVDINDNILHTVNIVNNLATLNDLVSYNCTITNDANFNYITLTFGDNVHSRKLTAGEYVLIKYADTKGANGNISATNVINKIKNTLLTSTGNIANLYVTNDDSIENGADYETLEEIKNNATMLFQSGYRAGSHNDWKAIVESHPSIYKAVVWTESDLGNYVTNQQYVYISAITTTGIAPSTLIQTTISLDYLNEKRSRTDIVSWQPLKLVNLKFVVDAVIPNVSAILVDSNIKTALLNKYSVFKVDFANSLFDSNFSAVVDPHVSHHVTEVFHVEKSLIYPEIDASIISREIVTSLPASVESDLAKQILIQNSSVEIWMQRKYNGTLLPKIQIGKTSAIPTILEGTNNYTISGGTVNYTTNKISYNIPNLLIGGTVPKAIVIDNTGSGYTTATVSFSSGTATATATISSGQIVDITVTDPGSGYTSAPTVIISGDGIDAAARCTIVNGSIQAIEPDPGSSYTAYGVLNPTDADLNGYFLEIVYKTVNGNGDYTNDIRLPYFYNIAVATEEDIYTNLRYTL